MGELHLEITLEKLRRAYNLDVWIGKVRVAYREAIGDEGSAEVLLFASFRRVLNSVALVQEEGRNKERRKERKKRSFLSSCCRIIWTSFLS